MIPISTYRLQFNHAFTFQDAIRIIPYLAALGVSHIYASSYLKAVPGSLHGYDISDPTMLNPEIGSEEDYKAFVEELSRHGMSQILDVVPNHMGIGKSSNPWWQDVLENGPSSIYAAFFDIDWRPLKDELQDKVLLPILGDLYGLVLEKQEITLAHEDGSFFLQYYEHRLPIAPETYGRILTHRRYELAQLADANDPHLQELDSIVTALNHLPAGSERHPDRQAERAREKEIVKRRLGRLLQESPLIAGFLAENVRLFNGTKGDPSSFDLLDGLLNEQAYRLSYWRVAAEEINYRRFFDINELVAIRMEDPVVFAAVHDRMLHLVEEGGVTGLRIDHVDGLYDPATYLRRLQGAVQQRVSPNAPAEQPFFLIVEKILGKGETLPADWPVHGTTGYDFLTLLNELFVDGENERRFDEVYARFTGERMSFTELSYEKKKLIMGVSMSSEINVLGHQLNRLSEKDRRSRDFTLNSLTYAIREIIACFPVYRTYVTADQAAISDRDRAYIRLAVLKAKRRNPAMSGVVFDFVRDLLLKAGDERHANDEQERLAFIMKFQQTTSPVTAKGIEDTAFYIYNRLASLNEVGGDPELFGISVSAFHTHMRAQQASWPDTLTATSTHDTKRGEDVRARINVLSEMPYDWKARLRLWSNQNRKYKIEVDELPVPDGNEEYLLYQTLVGAWPLETLDDARYRNFCDRIQSYMAKALQEARIHTSWLNPNDAYNSAIQKFIEAILDRTRPNPFLKNLATFIHQKIAFCGLVNSLSQVLIKIIAPGVPDFYQGTELYDLTLVDPDNRRPVDYDLRARYLAELQQARAVAGDDHRDLARSLLEARSPSQIKLYVTMFALEYRQKREALFRRGGYLPLEVIGSRQKHVCAFARINGNQAVVMVAPRLVAGLSADGNKFPIGSKLWAGTEIVLPSELPSKTYRNLFTGQSLSVVSAGDHSSLSVGDILEDFPVALLEASS
jgi:(1->4)-alpha-D-glucan 1-alpha-D-glucosylmutase